MSPPMSPFPGLQEGGKTRLMTTYRHLPLAPGLLDQVGLVMSPKVLILLISLSPSYALLRQ